MEIISRVDAKEKWLNRFYTGVLCKHGHDSERYTNNGKCVECINISTKKHTIKNQTYINTRKHAWYERNKPRILLERKQYRKDNREILNANAKIYRDTKRDKVANAKYMKDWWDKNREDQNSKARMRRQKNPHCRILNNMRSRMNSALIGNPKLSTTMKLLGCTIEFFKTHLQQTTIANGYVDFDIETFSGKDYHVDHIIPCINFNLALLIDQQKCFHWSNLQILDSTKNLKKSTRTPKGKGEAK